MLESTDQSPEELLNQLSEYIKLAKQLNVGRGARAVLQLQIEHIQHLLKREL